MAGQLSLTPEFVNSVAPPLRGERWCADTKVKGFGLRLWAGRGNGGKAFAIRVVSNNGLVIRRSFDFRGSAAFRRSLWDNASSYRLGDSLREARAWAKDEIAKVQGRLTTAERRTRRWRFRMAISAHLTLSEATDNLLSQLIRQGRSHRYIDAVNKLFSKHFRSSLGSTLIKDVDPTEIVTILVDRTIAPGNIRLLKTFLNQVLRKNYESGKASDVNEAFQNLWRANYDVKHPELRTLTSSDFQEIFESLEADQVYWQQALCIRLFFEFGSPMTRVMAAQWAQFVGGFWFPYLPAEKKLWFESRENLGTEALRLLELVHFRHQANRQSSVHLFPSEYGRRVQHIATVDTVWRNTLHDLKLGHYSLWEFAKSYRNPNNPSELGFFGRYYGPIIRREMKANQFAKILRQRHKMGFTSEMYKKESDQQSKRRFPQC